MVIILHDLNYTPEEIHKEIELLNFIIDRPIQIREMNLICVKKYQAKMRDKNEKLFLEKKRIMSYESYNRHKKKYSTIRTRHRTKLRYEVLFAYSNGDIKCSCCGEKSYEFLTLDHIYEDGAKERKDMNGDSRRTSATWQKLRKNNFPNKDKYQVLCYNCNCAKHLYGGVCPHQTARMKMFD